MGNPGKANLYTEIYFTRFVLLVLGLRQPGQNRLSCYRQNPAKPCFQSRRACICEQYQNTSPKRTFEQKYALEGWFQGFFGPL